MRKLSNQHEKTQQIQDAKYYVLGKTQGTSTCTYTE